MRFFDNFVLGWPKVVILLALLLAAALASGIPKLIIDDDLKAMIPEDMPSRQTLNELEEIFGGSDVAMIGIENTKNSIFNVSTLQKIRTITEIVEVMPDINRVTSLATIKYMAGHDWGLEVTPYLEEEPQTDEDALKIRDMFFADSTYVGKIVSADGNFTAIIASVSEEADLQPLYDQLQELLVTFEGEERFYLAGTPIVTTVVSKSIKGDLQKLIPFVILLILILLYVSFRTLRGVFLPFAALVMSLLSMMGFMGHLGITFTIINNIMPVILLGIGIDYGIHFMAMYYQELIANGDKRASLSAVIDDIKTPLFMACLTTMAGFLSLLTSPLDTHHDFGIVLAFGVFMAMLYNMTFVPAVLMLLPIPEKAIQSHKGRPIESLLGHIGSFVVSNRRLLSVMAIIIAVVSILGTRNVNIEMNPLTFFPEDRELVQADRAVNANLGGTINLNVLFKGNAQSREMLESMDDLQTYMESFPETGTTMSLATVVKSINSSLNENKPEFEVIPEDDEAVAQALLMYSISGDPDDFETIVDNSYEYAQVIAMMKSLSTREIAEFTNKVEKYIEENIPDDIEVSTTGFSVFFKDLAYLIVEAQTKSIALAVIFVFIIAMLTYRSILLGLIAIIPLSLGVLLNFGIMGYAGIDLNIPTAMMSSIIIGIGVDFSFHLISRFKKEQNNTDSGEAVRRAIKKVGEPILYSALTTAMGGLVLTISGFVPVKFMGFLLALIMIVCAILAITVVASFLSMVKTK